MPLKGYKQTKEHIKNIKKAMKGKVSNVKGKHWKWSKEDRKKIREKNSHLWKGDNAGYLAMHNWVERKKGKAKTYKCEHCKKQQAQDWANIDHSYLRVLEDYIPLCRKCHKIYDLKNN